MIHDLINTIPLFPDSSTRRYRKPVVDKTLTKEEWKKKKKKSKMAKLSRKSNR